MIGTVIQYLRVLRVTKGLLMEIGYRPVVTVDKLPLLLHKKVGKKGIWTGFLFFRLGVKGRFRYLVLSLLAPNLPPFIKPFLPNTISVCFGGHYTGPSLLVASISPEKRQGLIGVILFPPPTAYFLGRGAY